MRKIQGVFRVMTGLCAVLLVVVLGVYAAPSSTATITANNIENLSGSASDFWRFDTFDTDGVGVGGDPTLTLAAPPTTLANYGTTAVRLASGSGDGGSGCARLGGKPFLGTDKLEGVRLNQITELGYSYLVDANSGLSGAENLTPYINIFVDLDDDGVWRGANDSILIYEPFYTKGAPTLDTVWYDNAAIGTGADGRWHYAAQALPGVGQFTPNTVDLWSEIIAQPFGLGTVGDLEIVNPDPGCGAGNSQEGTGSGLVITVGQKSGGAWSNYVGFVDAVYVTTSVGGYDFVHDFSLTGAPSSIVIVSGENQTTNVNTAFQPLVAEVRDSGNQPIGAGVTVTVTVPVSGASATFISASATTNASSQVTFYPFANGTPGNYTVTLAAGAANVNTTFTNNGALPPATVSVFAADIDGLSGDATDFWKVDYYDTNISTDNPSALIQTTVNAAPSAGLSSLQMLVGGQEGTNGGNPAGCTGAGGKTFFGTTKLAGLPLRDLDLLGYATMLESVGAEDTNQTLLVYVNLFVDYNNDGEWRPADDGILVYDSSRPGNLTPPYILNQWYDIGDLTTNASSANWFFAVRSPFVGDLALNQVDTATGVDKFQELLYHPNLKPSVSGGSRLADLKIVNPFAGCTGSAAIPPATEGTGSGVAFVYGQKNGNGYSNMDAHLDSIRLVTSGGGALNGSAFYDITTYGAPAAVQVVSGSPQSALVSTAFTNALTARVVDAGGNPVPGVSVTFSAPGAGASASLGTPSSVSDANGLVTTTATANATSGSYTVTANTAPPITGASFALTNNPTAPGSGVTDLIVTTVSQAALQLSWTDVATASDQYEIYRSLDGINFTLINTVPDGTILYLDSTLVCGTTYTYRVDVVNVSGNVPGNVANGTTGACSTLLRNGSFNADAGNLNRLVPRRWTGVNLSNDRAECSLTTTLSFDGPCFMRFFGNPGESGRIYQDLTAANLATLGAGDTLNLSAYARTRNAGAGRVVVTVTYASAPAQSASVSWAGNSGYQQQTTSLVLTGTPTSVRVIVRGTGTSGQFHVDTVSLTRTPVAAPLALPPAQ